jgi:hypothetical protein
MYNFNVKCNYLVLHVRPDDGLIIKGLKHVVFLLTPIS